MRGQTRHHYVYLNKQIVADERLSWKAKGIYSYICSLNDRPFKVNEATKASPQGIKALQSGLKELKEYGYLKREGVYKLTKKCFETSNYEDSEK